MMRKSLIRILGLIVVVSLMFLSVSQSVEGGVLSVPQSVEGENRCPPKYSKRTWRNCVGTCTHASGNKYVGEFRNGLRHGKGTFTFVNGEVKEGIWKDGKLKYVKKISPY
jgi:hypothetical protein